jgi:sirohydrochlorin ferrochelatase
MKKYVERLRGLVFIAHGSRNTISNQQIEILVKTVARNTQEKYRYVSHAFLEFAAPSISDAVTGQIDAGINEVILFPYFLTNGNHVSRDIPEIVQTFKLKFPNINFIILPVFGSDPAIAALIQNIL